MKMVPISNVFVSTIRWCVRLNILREFTYYEDYFTNWSHYRHFGHYQRRTELKLKLIQLDYAVALGLACVYMVAQSRMSHWTNVALNNMLYLEGVPAYQYIWVLLSTGFCMKCFNKMYFHNFGMTAIFMYDILIKQNDILMLWRHFNPQQHKRIAIFWKDFHRLTIAQMSKRCSVWLLNCFQMLYYCNICYFVLSQINVFHSMKSQNKLNCMAGYLIYGCYYFFAVLHLLTTHLLLNSTILVATFAVLAMLCANIKLSQMVRFVQLMRVKFSQWKFQTCLQQNATHLKLLDDINRVYGELAFWFLLVNLPANAMLVMLISTVEFKFSVKLFLSLIAFMQILFIFCTLWSIAVISLKIHRPAKLIIGHFVRCKCFRRNTCRLQLKMSIYIEQFHTTNPYTVNYGKYGKMTFGSFGRLSFYYCKFLIFAYNLLRKFK